MASGTEVLDELLRHMAVQHQGSAAAASGRATVLAEWHMPPPMPDPIVTLLGRSPAWPA